MAYKDPSNTSNSAAAVPSPATTAPIANQSQSRLTTLPKELRNKIYTFLFSDSPAYTFEPIKHSWDTRAVMAQFARPICLDSTAPPSKDSILPCRQLHFEIKQMHATTYRAYWTKNSFLYANNAGINLPADKDMKRIREFRILMHHDYHLRIVFDDQDQGTKWDSRLLRSDGGTPRFRNLGMWFVTQDILRDDVNGILQSIASNGLEVDPRVGRGIGRDILVAMTRFDDFDLQIRCLHEYLNKH